MRYKKCLKLKTDGNSKKCEMVKGAMVYTPT